MKCPRCLNQNPELFIIKDEKTICRACLHLMGKLVEPFEEGYDFTLSSLQLNFKLSSQQEQLSQIINQEGLKKNILVEAVCGAGKTELVLKLIHTALSKHLKVGWMVARRQVVLQLYQRLVSLFPEKKVLAVTSGFTSDLQGDFIICTAHQLYRFPHYFDLMIIDEPDAFPYKGDQLLEGLVNVSCQKTKIYLSATPDQHLVESVDLHLFLHSRPHQRPLVIPQLILCLGWMKWWILSGLLRKLENKSVLIFVPTLEMAQLCHRLLRRPVLTSQTANKDEIITQFEQKKIHHLICTTVLERGMTFEKVHVIVLDAHHPIYDEASLIQISGRVGRSFTESEGSCWFISQSNTQSIDCCLKRLKKHNKLAFGV